MALISFALAGVAFLLSVIIWSAGAIPVVSHASDANCSDLGEGRVEGAFRIVREAVCAPADVLVRTDQSASVSSYRPAHAARV